MLEKHYNKIAVITDKTVGKLYALLLVKRLCADKICVYTMPAGERGKSLKTYGEILQFLAANGFDRQDLIVALGGGVVGDTAGFAAATYMRGIAYVQVPTTLLAMADSGIGGKTAINICLKASAGTEYGKNVIKNLAGCFWQPVSTVIDVNYLKTLPRRELKNGLAEIIKCGCIADKQLFDYIAASSFAALDYQKIIDAALAVKRALVQADERDLGARRLLNFGHTFGHAIEAHSNFAVPHGAAVAIGMVLETKYAESLGLAERGTADKIAAALKRYGIKTHYNLSAEELLSLAKNDKKRHGGKPVLALVKSIGNAFIY